MGILLISASMREKATKDLVPLLVQRKYFLIRMAPRCLAEEAKSAEISELSLYASTLS